MYTTVFNYLVTMSFTAVIVILAPQVYANIKAYINNENYKKSILNGTKIDTWISNNFDNLTLEDTLSYYLFVLTGFAALLILSAIWPLTLIAIVTAFVVKVLKNQKSLENKLKEVFDIIDEEDI